MDNRADYYIRAVMPLKDYRLFMEMESGSSSGVNGNCLERIIRLPGTALFSGSEIRWGGCTSTAGRRSGVFWLSPWPPNTGAGRSEGA